MCLEPQSGRGLRTPATSERQRRARTVRSASARRSPLRADSPSVLGPVARRATRCAHCVRCARTGAARQLTKRADARGHGPCVPRRLAGALRPARARLCGSSGGLQRKDSDVPPSSAFAAAVAVAVAWPCLCGSDCAVAVAAHTQLRASIAPALACGRRMSTKWLRGRRSPVGATSGAARSAGAGSARVSAPRGLARRACSSAANAVRAASCAARPRSEHRSGVGAQRRPPQYEPLPEAACRVAHMRPNGAPRLRLERVAPL